MRRGAAVGATASNGKYTSLALSTGSNMPKMASKTDLGGHQGCQDGPRGPKEAPRTPQQDPQQGPKGQKPLIPMVCFMLFHVVAFSCFRRSNTTPPTDDHEPTTTLDDDDAHDDDDGDDDGRRTTDD